MRVLMPLPHQDFDPTEAGVAFGALLDAGHQVLVATPQGAVASPDPRMVAGTGLGPWRGMLMANPDGLAALQRMMDHTFFRAPVAYAALPQAQFDAVVLPGGHAAGMKVYLESVVLQATVAQAFAQHKVVGAICHGVVLASRARDVATGRSVLHGKKVTALTAWMELSAWGLTALWLGDYYRTYPQTVQAEVTAALASPADFVAGPYSTARDGPGRLDAGFVVRDGALLTARWPGDAHHFAARLVEMLRGG